MRKVFIFFLFLIISVCTAEDDILRNHKNLTPHEIVKKIEIILDRPANFRTKEDLVKRQQYLDLYKKNLVVVYPVEAYPIKWSSYYYKQQLLLFINKEYIKSEKLALWYAEALKKNSDIFVAANFLATVYLDLSYCNAQLGNKSNMVRNLQSAKKIFIKTLHGSLNTQYPSQSMACLIQTSIYEQEIRNYALIQDWDHVFSVISKFIKIYGNEETFEAKTYRPGAVYSYLSDYYKHQMDFLKAEYYAQKSNQETIKKKHLYLSTCTFLVQRYYEQGQYRKSLNICEMVFHLPADCHLTPRDFEWVERGKLLLIAAKCYAVLGQKEKCLEYLNLAEAKSKDPAIHKQIQNIRDKIMIR